MPIDPLPPRACRFNPTKYAFSENETDEEGDSLCGSPNVVTNSLPPNSPSTSAPSFPPSLPPPCKSHSRKRSPSHIRRPRNAFIIFRSEFCCKQKASEDNVETDHRQISRIAAYIWRDLAEDEKAEYKRRAEEEKAAHKIAYPDYRYAPVGRPRAVVRQKSKRCINEEIFHCRTAAEQYLSSMQGKTHSLSRAVPPYEKINLDSISSDQSSPTNKKHRVRRQPVKRPKESSTSSISVALPGEPEQKERVDATNLNTRDNGKLVSNSPSPLVIKHDSPLQSNVTRPRVEAINLLKPVSLTEDSDMTYELEQMPPSLVLPTPVYQDSLMASSMDQSSMYFSTLALGQLFKAPDDDPSNSALPYLLNSSSSEGCDEEELYLSTPSESLISDFSTGNKDMAFSEVQLEEKEILDSLFQFNDTYAHNDMDELEEYVYL